MKHTKLIIALVFLSVCQVMANWELTILRDSICPFVCRPNIISLFANNNYLFAGVQAIQQVNTVENQGTGIYRSIDTGATWIQTGTVPTDGWGVQKVNSFVRLGSYIYVGADKGVYRSNNNGLIWNKRDSGLVYTDLAGFSSSQVIPFFCIGKYLIVGTIGSGFFLTNDSGKTWTQLAGGIPCSVVGSRVVCAGITSFCQINASLLTGTSAGVYSSSDSGASWIPIHGMVSGVVSFANYGGYIFAGTQNGHIYRSANSGYSWEAIDSGLPTGSGTKITSFANKDSAIFVGASPYGVYCSIDTGKTWSSFSEGLADNFVQALLVNGRFLFAGTHNGLFRYALYTPGTTTEQNNVSDLSNSGFVRIAPNPFNSNTHIYFSTSYSAVRLIIYDIKGAKMATLVNNQLNPGLHEVTFHGHNLQSGIYLCRLQVGSVSQTCKILFQK